MHTLIRPLLLLGALGFGTSALGQEDADLLVIEDQTRIIRFLLAPPPGQGSIEVTIKKGPRTVDLASAELREARIAMLAGREITPDQLRALAEAGDGLAAQRYVHWLLENEGGDEAIAFYGLIAAQTGRGATFSDVTASLNRIAPGSVEEGRLTFFHDILLSYARAGNVLAIDALFQLSGEGKLFAPLTERERERLLTATGKIGDGRIEIELAAALMINPKTRSEKSGEILSYLNIAASSSHLGVRTAAIALIASMNEDVTSGEEEDE